MGAHLINNEFQSDKYPSTPRNCVPLKVTDRTAQDLLYEYAQRRRPVDAEFSADLETALSTAGFVIPAPNPSVHVARGRDVALIQQLIAEHDTHVGLLREFAEAELVAHNVNNDTWSCCGHHINFDNHDDPAAHYDTCKRKRARTLLGLSDE